MLYINPEDCIECDACLVECPVEAIFQEDDVPSEFQNDILLNAKMSQVYPQISERKQK